MIDEWRLIEVRRASPLRERERNIENERLRKQPSQVTEEWLRERANDKSWVQSLFLKKKAEVTTVS